MIRRVLRICGFLAAIVLGVVFLVGALIGLLLQVAAHFAIRNRSPFSRSEEDDLRSAGGRDNFRNGVKRGLVLAVVGLLVAALLGGLVLAASGVVPIAASSGHWPITEWFLQFAMQRSIWTHSFGIEVPSLDDSDLLLKGATHYEVGCRPCHGSPDTPLPPIPAHMTPPPPDLLPRLKKLQPRELFYVVKHGVKFTGMPAWPAPQRDDEVWAVVAFLKQLPQLDASAYLRLVGGDIRVTAAIEDLSGPPGVPSAVVQNCVRCHGIDGVGRGEGAFPKLAGQRRDYLENALKAYASGERHSGTMGPISAGLRTDAIAEVARYYGQLAPSDLSASSADQVALERGRTIAEHGITQQRVPSCVDCHAPEGERYNPNYPALEGQYADYLVLQLELFKKGQRGGSDYSHLMEPIAKRLEPDQMREVAEYFESLRPRQIENNRSEAAGTAVSEN